MATAQQIADSTAINFHKVTGGHIDGEAFTKLRDRVQAEISVAETVAHLNMALTQYLGLQDAKAIQFKDLQKGSLVGLGLS